MELKGVERCKMCGYPFYAVDLDELGYCETCEPDVVEHIDKMLMAPLYVYRMAKALQNSTWDQKPGILKSAATRQKNAEKEIIRLMATLV